MPVQSMRLDARSALGLVRRAAHALRNNPPGIFVQSPRLRNRIDRFLNLRIRFEFHFKPFLLAICRHEDFLLDLALDPVKILGDFWLGVADVLLREIFAEVLHHRVVRREFLGYARPSAEIIAGEAADTGFVWKKHVGADQSLLEFGELWSRYHYVWSDAAASGDLAAAVGELDLRRMLRHFALIVIFIERNGFVVALDQAAARSVVARGRQSQTGVFAQRSHGL